MPEFKLNAASAKRILRCAIYTRKSTNVRIRHAPSHSSEVMLKQLDGYHPDPLTAEQRVVFLCYDEPGVLLLVVEYSLAGTSETVEGATHLNQN